MDWTKVADSFATQAHEAVDHAEAIVRHFQPGGGGTLPPDQQKNADRHRTNANFCYAMAVAFRAGLAPVPERLPGGHYHPGDDV